MGSGVSAGTAQGTLQDLNQAHEQLMSLVLAQPQPQQLAGPQRSSGVLAKRSHGAGKGAPGTAPALHPRQHVQQVAARLQRQGNDADTVSMR